MKEGSTWGGKLKIENYLICHCDPGEEEYEYGGEEGEEVEEVEEVEESADYVPVFLTSPHTSYVHEGSRATLECRYTFLNMLFQHFHLFTKT